MTTEEIYKKLTELKSRATWYMGKCTATKLKMHSLEYRKTKAKSYDKEHWDNKIKDNIKKLELEREYLKNSITEIKNFLNEQENI